MAGRAELMDEINEVSFALNETTLYLDTHPDDQQALAYFNELAPRRKELLKEYAQSYEPLTSTASAGSGRKMQTISSGPTVRRPGKEEQTYVELRKRLQFPVNITKTCPKTARLIISQFGGPDGELAASMRYLSQRYSMPCRKIGGLLTDIGTEELAHMEMICAMVYQLTKNVTVEEAKTAGFDAYYIDHTAALWPQAAGGIPFNACEFQSKGDAITDLTEDLAAEQKARTTYDNLIRMIDNPEVREPLKFLRAREIVHFQRFGEALENLKDRLDSRNFYYFNAEFDKQFSLV